MLKDFKLGTCDLNTWNHFALVRDGSEFYGFKNGELVSKIANANMLSLDAFTFTIGSAYETTNHFCGYIDEFRISKGIARWTDHFDPEASADTYILRITMHDSSEREYKVSQNKIHDFMNWMNDTNGTAHKYYKFESAIDGNEEYLVYEKIISFKVFNQQQF